jgi:hypothetical protein
VCDTGNVRIYGGANVLQYLLRVGSTAGKMGGSRQPVIQQSLTPFCMEMYTGMYRRVQEKYVLFRSDRVA